MTRPDDAIEVTRRRFQERMPESEWPVLERFLENAIYPEVVLGMEVKSPGTGKSIGLVVTDGNSVFQTAFEMRARLDDDEFGNAWQPDGYSYWSLIASPVEPMAMLRLSISASLRRTLSSGVVVNEQLIGAFLIDPFQINSELLDRFSEEDTILLLIPESAIPRPIIYLPQIIQEFDDDDTNLNALRLALPFGVLGPDPVQAIETAKSMVARWTRGAK